jgi:hypothetical protein
MGAPSLQGFQLAQTFFGFKPNDRITLHENLFNLVWRGEGRWDWDTVYHMPIMLRRFWIKKINKMDFDAEAKAEEMLAKANAKKSTRKNSR